MNKDAADADSAAWRGRRFRPRRDLTVTDLGDELVVLDPTSQEMFALDPAGRFVWNALSDAALGQVAERLAARYGLEATVAARDVADLVAELRAADLLDPVDPASAPA